MSFITSHAAGVAVLAHQASLKVAMQRDAILNANATIFKAKWAREAVPHETPDNAVVAIVKKRERVPILVMKEALTQANVSIIGVTERVEIEHMYWQWVDQQDWLATPSF